MPHNDPIAFIQVTMVYDIELMFFLSSQCFLLSVYRSLQEVGLLSTLLTLLLFYALVVLARPISHVVSYARFNLYPCCCLSDGTSISICCLLLYVIKIVCLHYCLMLQVFGLLTSQTGSHLQQRMSFGRISPFAVF